jgi:signal transduction histidine kinase
MRLQRDWCDIRLVLEAAIACLPRENAASVSLACDAGLPVVWADHDRMEQVFVNLLNNAFGHNPPGTRVQVTAESGPAEVVIRVIDDGLGMPPELAAAPFEPARRPRATATATTSPTATATTSPTTRPSASMSNGGSRKSIGAGLGLSIAKGIMQAHGGSLELTSRPKGTCFSVYLPVEAEVLEAVRTPGLRGPDHADRTEGVRE